VNWTSTHKDTRNGQIIRRYTGIVTDYKVSGNGRNGYTVHASANTAARQQSMFRLIVTATLAAAIKKIERNEVIAKNLWGEENHPRIN
jgi:hypothetical protein